MPVESDPAAPGPPRVNKGKANATHTRHASIDENMLAGAHPRSSSSSFPSSSMQQRRPAANSGGRLSFHGERRSSETVFSQQSSQSASSGASHPPIAAVAEAASPANVDREDEPPYEEETANARAKDRARKHHRRPSTKRHDSPSRLSNPMDYGVQGPQDPPRGPAYHHSFNGRPPMPNESPMNDGGHPRFPPIQTVPGNFPNGYGSPERPFAVPDPPPVFVPSPMQASFPPMRPPPPPQNHQPNGPPLSGYELLAAKLSGNMAGPRLAPIYRRFESLHHRLLLHMQDELIEMEEQLHSLDAVDTQNRKFPGGIYPASRRRENMSPTDATWKKTEIMTHLAHKLYQYNQVMTSFNATHVMAEPSIKDVFDYKAYLQDINPLVDVECQFLDATDDLVNLVRRRRRSNGNPQDDPLSPMPRSSSIVGFPPPPSSQISNAGSSLYPGQGTGPPSVKGLAMAMAMIVLAPIICFSVIPGFVGRMTVVLLVGLGGAAALLQSGLFALVAEERSTLDWVLCAGVYGGVMAVIAGII
ncbi:hypothetical protein CCMA1212_000146 [Trichoderma ghanense]|uniref:DUF6594 domain-containing protein n=1 Tax=Trichoderma ghanense TaxID=65468 RepID=A0ABY2HHL7_9HYPO